jgi:hypothetical protein
VSEAELAQMAKASLAAESLTHWRWPSETNLTLHLKKTTHLIMNR